MRSRIVSREVTNITGARLATSVVTYPTADDVLGVLSRAVAREMQTNDFCYVSPSASVRNALFRFSE